MAFDDVAWVVFADKAEGRVTVLRADLDPYPGEATLNAALSDCMLQVYGQGDGVVALVATLAPATNDSDSLDFAVAATDVILERVGLDIRRTMTGTAFHVLPGTFAWGIGPTVHDEPG